MKIGEIVETLIYIKDHNALYGQEYEAVVEACNLLDKLPRLQGSNRVSAGTRVTLSAYFTGRKREKRKRDGDFSVFTRAKTKKHIKFNFKISSPPPFQKSRNNLFRTPEIHLTRLFGEKIKRKVRITRLLAYFKEAEIRKVK